MHYIDLLLMPSMRPIDWDSPKDLLKSAIRCLFYMSVHKDVYMLGHLAVHLSSPLVSSKDELIAMSLCNSKDKIDGVFKRHLGFGVLGEPIAGKLENISDLHHKITVYLKRKKFSFMRFSVSESGMRRVLSFIKYFQTKIEGTNYAPCDFYSGVMNPIYENEGAGCTSFGITLLKQAGVNLNYESDWKVNYNIPMNLVGGKFNNNHRISSNDVLKGKQWYPDDDSVRNIKYIESEMYDPSIMYNWVHKIHENNNIDCSLMTYQNDDIKGLGFDFSNINVEHPDKPLLIQREKENFFVNQYRSKILKK